ncbi:MAG: hypothetical protein ACRYGG_12250, partial [Janthinobacterium lividum]
IGSRHSQQQQANTKVDTVSFLYEPLLEINLFTVFGYFRMVQAKIVGTESGLPTYKFNYKNKKGKDPNRLRPHAISCLSEWDIEIDPLTVDANECLCSYSYTIPDVLYLNNCDELCIAEYKTSKEMRCEPFQICKMVFAFMMFVKHKANIGWIDVVYTEHYTIQRFYPSSWSFDWQTLTVPYAFFQIGLNEDLKQQITPLPDLDDVLKIRFTAEGQPWKLVEPFNEQAYKDAKKRM